MAGKKSMENILTAPKLNVGKCLGEHALSIDNVGACLEELSLSNDNIDELTMILSKISRENPFSETLFKQKYQFSILNNLFGMQKPLGELLKTAIVFCGAKLKKMSETESHSDEVFSENTESASLQFDSLLKFSSGSSFGENCILYPLSQNIGRKLLLMCNSIEIETLKKLPILAICHDQHPKPSVYIGSWKHNNNARFYIKNQGAVSIQAQLPRLSVLKEVHLKGFPQSVLNIEISVLAHYDFLLKRFDDHILKPVRDSNVFVECTWSNSLSILEPLTDECLCLAKIKSVIGNEYSGAFSMYKELKLVEALQQSLKTGMITWRNSKINSNVLQNIGELICRENEIILKKKSSFCSFCSPKKSDEDEKFLFSFEQSVIRGRANLDFTDKLWNVLKECSSTEELMEAITLVYHSLEDFVACPFYF